MELIVENNEIYWLYKGKKLNIKTDHEEIVKMWTDYRRSEDRKKAIKKVMND